MRKIKVYLDTSVISYLQQEDAPERMRDTLEISPDFTIEDIHRIRERNYERTRHMTVEEKLLYYNSPRTDAEERIRDRKRTGSMQKI